LTLPDDIAGRLASAEWLRRPQTQRIMSLLDGAEGRTRAVGGSVRDTLLGHPGAGDVDLATELLPDEVTRRAEAAGIAVYPTGIAHGTVTLALEGMTAEVTTLREDVETDGRHAVVRFGTDWQRDAERRDFTMNALYAGSDGRLFDPLGGIDDCLARRVRFIGEPARRIEEDRLRVFRFFRFSASHGGETLDPEGLAACRGAAGTLGNLAAERIGAEMRRMLALPRVSRTLSAMRDARVLDVSAEVIALLGRYEAIASPPGLATRLALLIRTEGQKTLLSAWRLSNDELGMSRMINAAADLVVVGALAEAFYRYREVMREATDIATVLAGWSGEQRAECLDAIAKLRPAAFPVGGNDLVALGLRPGKALGQELGRLERLWIDSGFTLTREALLSQVSKG